MKWQATDWEKILTSHKADKGLISGRYKELSKVNSKTNKQFNWKIGKRHAGTFH